jgi:hypothetical protein
MPITQSITVLPTPPSRADPENFDTRADAFLGALPTMQTQMNTWAGQANSTATTVNDDKVAAQSAKSSAESARDTAAGHASTATTQAGIATTQAGTATTQAGIATTQAGIATTQAGIATTQAGIATTKASEAAASAALAQDVVSGGLTSVTPAANKIPMSNNDGVIALGWLDLTGYAPAAKGVTNGDSHDHNGGDGAQIAYSSLSGLPTLGTAAATASTDYAPAAKGVTNGDSHDHNGGDGAQIAYSSLSGLPTLGTAASKDVGTGTGQVAAGDHTHASTYQPLDSDLTALAGLSTTGLIERTGSGTAEIVTVTTAGKAILDDTDAAAQRTTLGLGTGNSPQFTAIELGHASDTTLARSAAGQVTIEGVQIVTASNSLSLTNKTLTDPIIVGAIQEDVYTISDGAAFEIDPGNGSIQLITLGADRTPKGTNFAAGESVTLMVLDGSASTLTWTDTTFGTSGVTWVSGSAPTLDTTKYTVIELWKVGSQVYGALVGVA